MGKRKTVLTIIVGSILLFTHCGKTLSDLGTSVSMNPPSATVATGQTQQFQAIVNGSPYTTNLMWSVNGLTGGNTTTGTISGTGLYTAPQSVPNPNMVTITVVQQATNQPGVQLFAGESVQVTIIAGSGGGTGSTPSVSISVSPTTIASGQSATLAWSSANVDSCTINGATTINGTTIGTSGSVQVAPTQTTSYQINCTGTNGSISGQAQLTVQSSSAIIVAINPSMATLTSGGTMSFSAVVTNDPTNQGVQWSASVGPAPVSTSLFTATYTAPQETQNTNVNITATSVASPAIANTATVTITPAGTTSPLPQGPPQASISPQDPALRSGGTQTFTATITGDGVTNTAFTWMLRPGLGVDPNNMGTIVSTGPSTALYTAPTLTGNVFINVDVVAISVQFPNVPLSTIVSVSP